MSYTLNIEPNIVKEAESRAARNGTTIDALIRACLLVFVSHDAANDGDVPPAWQNAMPHTLRIGSMKDEINLPDDFDEAFDSLDREAAALFSGLAS